jgi:predicted deacylase
MRNGLSKLVILLWSTTILVLVGIAYLLLTGQFNLSPAPPAPVHTTPSLPDFSPTPQPPSATPSPPTPTSSPSPVPPSPTPTQPQPLVIGYSVADRPLEMYHFGTGPTEKLIVAGIHGGYEYNTIDLADELIAYLETHPDVVPPDQTLYFLRAFNPDGYERSHGFGGRANGNNVDLNRNFPFEWQADWPRAGCWDYIPIHGGTGPASEPETQALIKFIKSHEITALISYHSAALGIFAGGQPAPDPGSLSLASAVSAVSAYPYPPIEAGCKYTGQFIDWASDQGIPAIDIELTNHQDTDFEINLAILSVFLDWSAPE